MNKALIYILTTTITPTCLPGQCCVVAKVSRVVVSSLLQYVVARVFWMIVGWMLASQNSPPTSLSDILVSGYGSGLSVSLDLFICF